MKTIIFAFVAISCLSVFTVCVSTAQTGGLDPAFGTNGRTTTNVGGEEDFVYAVAIQPDGKIIAVGSAGDFVAGKYYYDAAIVRYNADGSLDYSFGTDGRVIDNFGNDGDIAGSVAVQSDGKIVVVGTSSVSAFAKDVIVRYNPNGTRDNTFGTGGKVVVDFGTDNNHIGNIAVQSDGKIVVAGFTSNGSNSDMALARYQQNGKPDSSFGTNGFALATLTSTTDKGNALLIQSDGKIVVIGSADQQFAVARFDAQGRLDASFGTAGATFATILNNSKDQAYSGALQSDGKIVVVGESKSTIRNAAALMRLNADGTVDSSFGAEGRMLANFTYATFESGYSVAIANDGKLLVTGGGSISSKIVFTLTRWTTDGFADVTFGVKGIMTTQFGTTNAQSAVVNIATDGKIVVAGDVGSGTSRDFAVARYLPGPSAGVREIRSPDRIPDEMSLTFLNVNR